MKLFHKLTLLSGLCLGILTGGSAFGQTLIIRDNFNAVSNFTGFALNEGANSGIQPPDFTRLTGSAAPGLRYINLGPRPIYYTTGTRLRINQGGQAGRFTLGSDDATPFDFGSALGVGSATPASPIEYDVTISMDNNASTARLSFGLATVTNDVTQWDFGFQIAKSGSGNYRFFKRIDSGSRSAGTDLNAEILPAPIAADGSEVDFLMRVTDAGAETSEFSSRVRLSVDGGTNWFYDTDADTDLGGVKWRLDGSARYFIGDIANNDNFVTYDNLSVTLNSSTSVTPAVLSTPTGTPGNLTINFTGTPGTTYTIERVATLPGTWQPLGTAMTDGSTGVGSYTDLVNHGSENSFYRVVFP